MRFNVLPVADAKIRYIYREIRLYIFYMWLYIMSLKNLMFHWYCLEGKCASFILGHNAYLCVCWQGTLYVFCVESYVGYTKLIWESLCEL